MCCLFFNQSGKRLIWQGSEADVRSSSTELSTDIVNNPTTPHRNKQLPPFPRLRLKNPVKLVQQGMGNSVKLDA